MSGDASKADDPLAQNARPPAAPQVAPAGTGAAAVPARPLPRTTTPRKSLDQMVEAFLSANPNVPKPKVLRDTPETVEGLRSLAAAGACNYLIKTAERLAKTEAQNYAVWLKIKVGRGLCQRLTAADYVFRPCALSARRCTSQR